MYKLPCSELSSLGHYVPANRIENHQLEKHFQLEPGWIEQRTGIKARHWVQQNEWLVDIAEKAGMAAIKKADVSLQEIALLILATSTPDHLLPPTSPLLAHRLQLSHCLTYDLTGACSGFLHALVMADGFVRTQKKAALIVAANILSRRINLSDYKSAVLFGDAAGAMIIKPSTSQAKGILGISFLSDGSGCDLISITAGGSKKPFSPDIPLCDYKIKLGDGRALFAKALKMMTQCAASAMQHAQLSVSDIRYLVPHQANARMAENITKKLGFSRDKTVSIVEEYGNSSSAGIPLALSMRHETKRFRAGERILLTTAGAGLTASAIIWGI